MSKMSISPIGKIMVRNGEAVIELKRAENPSVPDWCAHLPKSNEESGDFERSAEFNF